MTIKMIWKKAKRIMDLENDGENQKSDLITIQNLSESMHNYN